MRRSRGNLRRRYGSHAPRSMWRVFIDGIEVGFVSARGYDEALTKAERHAKAGEKVHVEAV